MNTTILESKLKRHKISYFKEDGKVIIGKPKTDYLTIIGLIAFPVFAGIGIIIISHLNSIDLLKTSLGIKILVATIILFGIEFLNYFRLKIKNQINDGLKTLEYKSITLTNEFEEFMFDSTNIKDFAYSTQQIDEENYVGNLYLIDNEEKNHQILGFIDEKEIYVLNDLKWFSNYLMKHVEIK